MSTVLAGIAGYLLLVEWTCRRLELVGRGLKEPSCTDPSRHHSRPSLEQVGKLGDSPVFFVAPRFRGVVTPPKEDLTTWPGSNVPFRRCGKGR